MRKRVGTDKLAAGGGCSSSGRDREPGLVALNVAKELDMIAAAEGCLPCNHLKKNRPDAPEVGLGVVFAELQNLGRHVKR